MARPEAAPTPEPRHDRTPTAPLEKSNSTGLGQQLGDIFAESLANRDVTAALVQGRFLDAGVAAAMDPEVGRMLGDFALDLHNQNRNAESIEARARDLHPLNKNEKLGFRDGPNYVQQKRAPGQEEAPGTPPAPEAATDKGPALPPNHALSAKQSFESLSEADPTKDGKLTKSDLEALAMNLNLTSAEAAFAAVLADKYSLAAAEDGDASSVSEADVNALAGDHAEALNRLMNERLRQYATREKLGLPYDASEADVRKASEERGLNEAVDVIMKHMGPLTDLSGAERMRAVEAALENGISPETIVAAVNERLAAEGAAADNEVTVKYDKQADVYTASVPHPGYSFTFSVGPDGKLIRD